MIFWSIAGAISVGMMVRDIYRFRKYNELHKAFVRATEEHGLSHEGLELWERYAKEVKERFPF